MSEIDVFELKKQIKTKRIEIMQKLPSYYITILCTSVQITNAIHINSISTKIVCFMSIPILIGSFIRHANKKIPTTYELLNKELKETKIYKECINEYNIYVTELAKLIKMFNLSNPKEIIIFYEEMLRYGLLSKDYFSQKINHEYHKFEFELNPIEELTGARVASGKTVCRHQSYLLISLLNELNIKASNISVKKTNIKEFKKLAKQNSDAIDHSLVGIEESDNKYMFDCTANSFVGSITTSDIKDYLKTSGAQSIETKETIYYYISKYQNILNPNTINQRISFEQQNNMTVDIEELKILRKKIEKIMDINNEIIIQFYISQIKRLEKITELESQLCPASDEPILKWVLK